MADETILSGDSNQFAGISDEVVIAGNEQVEQLVQSEKFDYSKMVGAEGALSENWKEGLPESIRNEKCLEPIKTIGSLAQSYVHAQKSFGANKIVIPGEAASPEEMNAFFKALGRPDEEDGYQHDKISIPDGIFLDEEKLKHFKKVAYENGLNQKTFSAILEFDIKRAEEQQKIIAAEKNAEYHSTLGKLRAEFGANFETVVDQCNKAMETFGLTEVLRENGLLNNYTIIKALAGIGEKISESKLKGEGADIRNNDPSLRLAEIQGNLDDPYYKKDHPGHNARVAEVNGLLAALAKLKK